MFLHEYGWFLAFWLLITALCLIEALWPGSGNDADRKRRWPVNFGFGIFNGLIVSLVPSLTIFSAMWAAAHGVGVLNIFECPLWLAIFVTLTVKSFAQYAFHRCVHFFPILWRVHRVHHCDNHLDASSALRFHPFEMIAAALFAVPFALLFGLPPKIVAVYEAAQIVAATDYPREYSHSGSSRPRRAALVRDAGYCIAFIIPRRKRTQTAIFAICFRFGTGCSVLFGTSRAERPARSNSALRTWIPHWPVIFWIRCNCP